MNINNKTGRSCVHLASAAPHLMSNMSVFLPDQMTPSPTLCARLRWSTRVVKRRNRWLVDVDGWLRRVYAGASRRHLSLSCFCCAEAAAAATTAAVIALLAGLGLAHWRPGWMPLRSAASYDYCAVLWALCMMDAILRKFWLKSYHFFSGHVLCLPIVWTIKTSILKFIYSVNQFITGNTDHIEHRTKDSRGKKKCLITLHKRYQ